MQRYWSWLIGLSLFIVGCAPPPVNVAVRPTLTKMPPATVAIERLTSEPMATAVSPTSTPTLLPTLTPTPTSTLTPRLPLIEQEQLVGLVLADASGQQSWQLLTTEGVERLGAVMMARLLGGILDYAVHEQVVYTAGNKDVIALTDDKTVSIPTLYDEKFVYGFVGDWLLVGFVEPDEEPSQTMGALAAMTVDGTDFRPITEERAYTIPIIAPDNSMVVYVDGDEARAWYADDSSQSLPYGDFRSGAFSPDGSYLALLRWGELDVYDVDTQQLVVSSSNVMMGGDGFMFPTWHPDGHQVAFTTYIPENERPFGTRLLSLDGTVLNIPIGSFPVFHPDGHLLALYQNITGPQTIFVDLASGQWFESSFSGVPFAWLADG